MLQCRGVHCLIFAGFMHAALLARELVLVNPHAADILRAQRCKTYSPDAGIAIMYKNPVVRLPDAWP